MDTTAETPLPMATGTVGAANEGKLVVVEGRIVGDIADDRPWGWKIYLDDGSGKLLVFVASETGIDVSRLRPGHTLKVAGISARYQQHVELLPRSQADISPP